MKKLTLILGFLLAGITAESSILSYLREMGNYTYFLRLIEEANSTEWGYGIRNNLESKAGITVFVADDEGWQLFFKENAKRPLLDPWHSATSYEALTEEQKRLLCNTAITSNNISKPDEIRFESGAAPTDRVEHLSSSDLPTTYSQNEKWYWERFSEMYGGTGIYLASDSSSNYINIFTRENTNYHGFMSSPWHDDCNIIFGKSLYHVVWDENWNYEMIDDIAGIANGVEIQYQGTHSNGTTMKVATPLIPLQSMADVIRTNGKTHIFSHILDRFSAPFYCGRITNDYKWSHPEFTDSVFIKRYFSKNNYSTKAGYVMPNTYFEPGPLGTYRTYDPYKNNPDRIPALKFDPGWSAYCDDKTPEQDMAAMFVPSDEKMWWYFTEGAGTDLIWTHYFKDGAIPYTRPNNLEELYQQIDAIPVGTLDMFVNCHMQPSFVNSVPSKWSQLTNDAGEPLFEDVDMAIYNLDTCMLANNGVIYVMNRIIVPPDFYDITGPAVISTNSKIMKSAIYGDFMNLNYDSYLKDGQNRFSFFLPTDDALQYYYDPASMKSRTPRAIKFNYVGGNNPVTAKAYNYYGQYNQYDEQIGTIGYQIAGQSGKLDADEVTKRLKDILESHTIVHDGTNPMKNNPYYDYDYGWIYPNTPLPEYYLSKNGCPIKIVRDKEDIVIAAKGGFQLENERQGLEPDVVANGVLSCSSDITREMNNGYTFVLNAPLVPTWRSVYSIFTNDADMKSKMGDAVGGETPYSGFYNLCTADAYETEIIGCGLVDGSLDNTQREAELKKYKVFVADNGLDYNVSFFNDYHYTIFVPTNEAIRQAIADGLPTWQDIYEDYHSHCIGESDVLATHADSLRIAAKISYLTNFVRYHFADKSVFVDKPALEPQEMVTASYDRETGQFRKLHVDRVVRNSSTTDLRVCNNETWNDNGGSMADAFTTVGEKNVLTRDISCSSSPVGVTMLRITINTSSSAVIHSIPDCLNHTSLIDGRHDKTWETIMHDEDAIQDVKAIENRTDDLYDISGRKISHPAKGIYIRNGKKFARTSGRKP